MKKNADNFEVYSAEFLSEDGEVITLSGKVELLFRADDYFDRTKAEVYYMDDNGSLTKLSASGYGRYVVTATDKTERLSSVFRAWRFICRCGDTHLFWSER